MFGSEYSLKPDYIGQPWPNKEKRLKETVQGSVNWIFSSEFDLELTKIAGNLLKSKREPFVSYKRTDLRL